MTNTPDGWTFADSGAMEWNDLGPGIAMKMLGGAEGSVITMFKFEAGYVGGVHEHTGGEFTYVLEGDLVSNGVPMAAGHAYAVGSGTTHDEFRTENGCTLVSVFPQPG